MADGMTTTGLHELRAAVKAWPTEERAALKAVARATAGRVQARAKANLAAQTRGTGATAAAITIEEDDANKEFRVVSKAPRGKASNLPLFLEYGTVKMSARPYMKPAAQAENTQYRRDLEAAAETVARRVFKD